MEQFNIWTEVLKESLRSFGENFMGAMPSILGVILIFLVGFLLAKLVSSGVHKILNLLKFNELSEKVDASNYLSKANVHLTPSKLLSKFVYWILILLMLITASETLGWTAVSGEISRLISYLPKLLIASVIFIVGTYIAGFLRDVIAGTTASLGVSTGKILSSFVFYLLFIVVTLTALEQAGIDTTIISSNLLLILGSMLVAAAISYGLASKEILSNILAGYVGRNTFRLGMEIEVNGIRGVIESITSIGVILKDVSGGKTVVPSHTLITNTVKIHSA